MRSLDLDIINHDLERLEENVRATLARIRNLKLLKQQVIRRMNEEEK